METINHQIEKQNKFAYREVIFKSWKDMKDYLFSFSSSQNDKEKYVFRGHADSAWQLQPTIDRLNLGDAVSTESRAIADFKKDITIFTQTNEISFLDYPKSDEKDLNWLALMQHHGAATRLLDFSDSPFIATFFAMSNVYVKEKEKCIWAIPLNLIDTKNMSFLTDRGRSLDIIYEGLKVDQNNKYNILGYSYLNKQFERLFRQQGCFIYSMSSKISFYELLGSYFDNSTLEKSPLLKLTLKTKNHKDEILSAIADLKFMNITYSSLFPDLDGFSKDILLSEAYSK